MIIPNYIVSPTALTLNKYKTKFRLVSMSSSLYKATHMTWSIAEAKSRPYHNSYSGTGLGNEVRSWAASRSGTWSYSTSGSYI